MDKKHFPEFYRVNVQRIYRFLYFRCAGNKEKAEDLTQDVFLKAFNAFESYDPERSESSWIFTIARNHLINSLQKERPNVALEDVENASWLSADWPEKMALGYDQQRLWKAIGELPADDAKVIRRKYLEGWPYEDIAEELGKNSTALRVQAHRAIKQLKKILKQK